MKSKIQKVFVIILSLALLIVSSAGCNKNVSTLSNSNTISATTSAISNIPSSTTTNTSSISTTSDISTSTSSLPPEPYHPPHYNPYDDFDNANEPNMYKAAPKDAVHILMWRDWHKTEQNLINQYENLTGVKIKTTVTTEAEYKTKLISMINENDAPDIVTFQSSDFPGIITKSLQSLNNYYFRLNSNCWNKAYMDAYKINDLYFGVAMPSSWLCESGNYVTYYSPTFLKKCGVKETPYELYKKNNWNWETQNEIIRKVNENGSLGLFLQSYDSYMLSAGEDFVTYNGKQFTNKLGKVKENNHIAKAWTEVAKLQKNKCIAKGDLDLVIKGKVGLFTATSYGLYNESGWFTNDFAKNLEAVPVAGPKGGTAYTPTKAICWGVPKKAKNTKGAAYFLRYFLDVSNYNQSSTFHTKQFETIFKTITSASTKKTVAYGSGVSNYIYKGNYSKICDDLVAADLANISYVLNSRARTVTESITRANKDISRIKK
ncbi:MAG: extracellular solute-binding protein [Clostridia bacterium]|nr:extracellular solute-binding protein [Clostridia bacterium]